MSKSIISILFQYAMSMTHYSYFTFYFLTKPSKSGVCILHLQHTSVWTNHIPGVQQPHVVSGYSTGQ